MPRTWMHGADLHDLQKLLGHSDPRMTNRYAHLSNEHLGHAARRLDGVLALPPAKGYLRNNLRYAKSQDRQALIGYQQAIQRAVGDVSDALIGYEKYHGVRERQEQSVKDLQESVNVSLMRYRGGKANYLEVLDSQRSLFNAELTLAQSRNNEYQSLVQLYKALGGGWK